VLRDAGLSVDVLLVDEVDDLTPYAGAVVGSALYMGRRCKEAATFLEAHKTTRAERPVWLLSSGPTGDGDAKALVGDFTFPETLSRSPSTSAPVRRCSCTGPLT
jgi:menaquinone-dependent protoporphyrinogen IX oxidase